MLEGVSMRKTTMPYVRIDGSGSQIVLFLHGFMSSKNYWRRVIRQLDMSEYTTISIDLLGFNKAPKPTVLYDYDDHVQYVRTVITRLGLDASPIVLVGHSMGGLIAARYATVYPEQVTALGLLNPPIYKNSEQAKAILLSTGAHYRFLLTSRYRGMVWAAARYAKLLPKHTVNSREKSLKSVVMASEFLKDLNKISARTVLTVGTKDRWVYQKNIASIKLGSPLFTVRVDKTGHHAALSHPGLVAKYIEDVAS